ncbi:efflux transporter outer membrane subunit [Caulobacter sp. UNC279MFTsu5.1]|uniref:efflux transporter outer membrane subunit n=1 Tax=Caulobacter sp. UNC279MFTsu5.1 TaxID=1502775 RepID=UPI0008E83B80|nr:efflux transporter outer membrane subunit [Caulobacter sp. UNC279MFTsu5.1]SFK30491.1 efflux transporter, outer membrane factor (OMF) lipoprotein, NodT family [Caulobacter sp. UNC279MFTsu5.1]
MTPNALDKPPASKSPGSRAIGTTVSILLAALLTSACATMPAATPARVAKAPEAYATAQTLAASDIAAWPADAWWKAYGDAQLDALVDEALAGSPTLAQAEARLRRAQALANQAKAAQLPSVGANGGVERSKQSYNNGIPADFVPQGYNDYGRLSLDFSWELDFWGKNRAAVAAATSEAKAAQADAAQARLMLATSVAAGYADLARLYAERDVAERSVALRQETLTLVSDRVTNGLDTRGELRQAEAGPPNARAELAAIDEQIAQARNGLAALLGAGPDRGLAIARPSAAALKPFGLPANLAADLIGRRPDVVAAKWRAEAASKRIGQAKAAFYPNVNLAAAIGVQSLHLDKLFDSGSDVGSVGPAVSLPIFEGGRLKANLRAAEADRDGAVAAYDSAVTQALRDVADVAASERALSTRLTESRAALAASEDGFRIAKLRYQGGLSTYQNVLIAEQAVLSQRRIVADLESRALTLDVALVRALGGGFTPA